jgi:hypothetical protein
MSWKKKQKMEQSKYTSFDQCLLCKEVKETGNYTSDGELVCDTCCEWLEEEGRKINEM